jgi:peptidoglycan/LPS O-acetylase OafA/YrhL
VSTRIHQLDGIRGVAILLVIMHNQGGEFPSLHLQRLFANGWMGVDLFFVLSGFLITGILVDTKQSVGYYKNFYARRCLRIWPLYYSIIFFMFVVVPFLRPSEAHTIFEKSSPWWAYPLFLQNFLIPIATNAVGPLGVTWSLAVEEQFYLVWPLVVRYCSHAQIRRVALTVICLSPALRWYLASHHVNLYSNSFCRLDGLMSGALLALAVRSPTFIPAKFIKLSWAALFIAVPLAFVAQAHSGGWIVYSLSAMASASIVYLALFAAQPWINGVLTNRFMVYTGTISYGLYLLHKIPFDIAKAAGLQQHPLLLLLLLIVGCYAIAALSWNFLEKPFLRLKRFVESGRVPVDLSTRQVALTNQPWASQVSSHPRASR